MMSLAAQQCSQATDTYAQDAIFLDLPANLKYLNVLGACLVAFLERGLLSGVGGLDSRSTQNPARSLTDLVTDMELAVHEACTNIVRHAYEGQPGRIRVTVRWEIPAALPVDGGEFEAAAVEPAAELGKRALVIQTEDTGLHTLDMSQVPEPNLEEAQEHGYGLFLMRQLMDEVTYVGQPGKSLWRMVKYF